MRMALRATLLLLPALAAACSSPGGEAVRTGKGERPGSPRSDSRRDSGAAAAAPAVVLRPLGRTPVRVKVEIARTEPERRRGLMDRKELERDAGMLFIYEEEARHSFWMHRTLIPLDMVFLGADRRVVGVVENAEPLTEVSRGVDAPSKYVLEVNAFFARSHGLTAGTEAEFVGVPE